MEKWKVKTIEPVAEFVKEGTFSTVEIEADFMESISYGIIVFWRWSDDKKSKRSAVAVFSAQNLISAIKIKEEPTNA